MSLLDLILKPFEGNPKIYMDLAKKLYREGRGGYKYLEGTQNYSYLENNSSVRTLADIIEKNKKKIMILVVGIGSRNITTLKNYYQSVHFIYTSYQLPYIVGLLNQKKLDYQIDVVELDQKNINFINRINSVIIDAAMLDRNKIILDEWNEYIRVIGKEASKKDVDSWIFMGFLKGYKQCQKVDAMQAPLPDGFKEDIQIGKINFIRGDIAKVVLNLDYDAALCTAVFDCIDALSIRLAARNIANSLKSGGHFIFSGLMSQEISNILSDSFMNLFELRKIMGPDERNIYNYQKY